MRQPRLKAPAHHPVAYYHCISRVVNREYLLREEEKEQFVKYMRLYEDFCGVQVVTFCVMSNHFHILVEIPKRPEELPSDEEFLKKLKRVYKGDGYGGIEQRLRMFRENGANKEAEAYRESFLCRMWDVGAFIKMLKQRFTQWYNRQNGRKGTLWEERYKSVLVEGAGEALMTMSAYIDLNPVRAGMVSDPAEYSWCGYAEAVAGKRKAVGGIKIALKAQTAVHGNNAKEGRRIKEKAKVDLEAYRVLLFGRGEEKGLKEDGAVGEAMRKGFSREKVGEVLAKKGKLTRQELLQCKVRYFADGAVLGSKAFVNEIFETERHRFGPKRTSGARPIRVMKPTDADTEPLSTLRDLRVKPVE